MADDSKKGTTVESDIAGAGRLLREIFFPTHALRDVAPPQPVAPPPPPTSHDLPVPPAALVIDAPVCATCAGKGKLGASGAEIDCPPCRGTGNGPKPVCMTCGGKKKLGAPGHEIDCPLCSPSVPR